MSKAFINKRTGLCMKPQCCCVLALLCKNDIGFRAQSQLNSCRARFGSGQEDKVLFLED
jgi:hypothetical protein